MLPALIEKLNLVYFNPTITVLDNGNQVNELTQSNYYDEVVRTKRGGDYSIFNFSLLQIKNIRKKNYDVVIVPHKQPKLDGMDNIVTMLPFLNVAKWLHCSTDNVLMEVGKYQTFFLFPKYLFSTLIFVPISLLFIIWFVSIKFVSVYANTNDKEWIAGHEDI